MSLQEKARAYLQFRESGAHQMSCIQLELRLSLMFCIDADDCLSRIKALAA